MSGSADPVSIKQEPETVVTEHSQTPDTDTDRLTLIERDKTRDATESSTFLKTQTAAEVGLDTETDIKQERSWIEKRSVQADHDDGLYTTATSSDGDMNSFSDKAVNIQLQADVKSSLLTESFATKHDMETTESADMSQYRKCQDVHTIGTEQVIHIKQEIDNTDFHSGLKAQTEAFTHCTTEKNQESLQTTANDEPAVVEQEQISQGIGPCATFKLPGDAKSNNTQIDSISVKTEPQVPMRFTVTHPVMIPSVASISDMDVELEGNPKQVVFPVGLYRNLHATDSQSETSVTGQLAGETTSIDSITNDSPFLCKQCMAAFSSLSDLKRHMKKHPEIRPYACKQCSSTFKTTSLLNRHTIIHTGEKPHVCDQCEAAFSRANHLKEHMMTHTGDKPFRCEECGGTFSRSSSLKQHMMIHTGDKPYMCKKCGAAFSRHGSLKKHTRIHTGERPYVCKECGAAFSQSSHYRQHIVMHSDDKPYKCKQCGAAYNWSTSFKRHMMTHTGEKPYVCKECGTAFRQSKCLNRHMMTHTGDKPYVCKECGKAFTQSGKLKRHMMTHTGEKPYMCKQCGAAFNQSGNLKQHIKTHT